LCVLPSESKNFLERLRDFETDVVRFMDETIITFSGNQAANDLRITKMKKLH